MKRIKYTAYFTMHGGDDEGGSDSTSVSIIDRKGLPDDEVKKRAVKELKKRGEDWYENEVTCIARENYVEPLITVLIADGVIAKVTGIPENMSLKLIDADWGDDEEKAPQVHIYTTKGERHRAATKKEIKEHLGEDFNGR